MKFWSLLLILRVNSFTLAAQKTPLMQSLDCFNDYTTYTNCTWSEREDTRQFVRMSLFYKDNYAHDSTQMTCNSPKTGSYRNWSCSKRLPNFSYVLENIYIFKPDKKLEAQLSVSLINNVQPLPPQKLSVRAIEGGHVRLEWEAGDGRNGRHLLDGALDFEVSYKQIWEHWEKSSSILVSNTSHYLLRNDSLVPGSNYSARVRSILRQDSGLSGHPSEWSSEIHWNTPEGDEAQPKNLRCLFNGIDRLHCSWVVRQEVTSSVLFSLFYRDSPGSKEKECSPVQTTELSPNVHIPYVLQSCEIAVTDRQSQYHVTVRPKEETKKMGAAFNIKPHRPFNLSIQKMDSQAYRLRWETDIINKHSKLQKRYEISYWKTSKPLEIKTQDVRDSSFFTFTPKLLETATHYKAKVRAKVNRVDYDGPWSEWSDKYDWETESVLPPWGLLLVAPAVIILMAVGLCCGRKYILNKKNEWDANIPSPPRKFLLPDYFLNNSLDFSSQNTLGEDKISCTIVLERSLLVTSSESLGAESEKAESLSAYHNMELLKQFPLSTANVGQCLSLAGLPPVHDCICSAKGGLVQVFDFDGPYLQFPSVTSVPDTQQNLNAAPLETREPSVSLQYMEPPQSLWLQQQLMGKKNETAPLLSMVHDLEENKHPLSEGQDVSQGQAASVKLEQGGGGQRPQSPTTAKNPCQNGPLDYIATADLPLPIERDPLLLSPVETSNPEKSPCGSMETSVSQSPQTTDGVSSSGLCPKGQAPPAPSRTSQEGFGDYVMTLPGTSGSASKEGLPSSPTEPRCDKGFFLFNPGDSGPVFLRQVGDYCFFPGTKPVKATKSPRGSVGHSLSGTNQTVTKPHKKSEFVVGQLQPSPHISIDTSALVSQ
ncbi:cytokine receptor common subunit beta [Tiliqua scincoides]|uniref:cytokine receptor common subunit beta n=1 Tax=Tiliqua scincoides TaxID=71010 RepID=UPI003461C949